MGRRIERQQSDQRHFRALVSLIQYRFNRQGIGLARTWQGRCWVPRNGNLLFNPTFYFEEKHHEQHSFQ